MKSSSVLHNPGLGIPALILFFFFFGILCCGATAAQQTGWRTTSPHGALSMPCGNCHTTISWSPIRPFPDFNHGSTRFQLQGMHEGVDCRQCHVKLVFASAGTRCIDCHADIHRRRMGNNCEECHNARGWREVVRNVNGHQNRFPLFGAHAAADCEDCHKSAAVGQFRGLSTECATCHAKDFQTATAVDHQSAGFSQQCETCHGFQSWTEGFDHTKTTGFSLIGAHSRLDCLQCHVGGKFAGTPADCVGCHLADYSSATNPNHVQARFPKGCSACHSSSSWQGSTFDHSTTQFPLAGAHASVLCADCHKNGQYAGLPAACVSCHLADFNAAANPDHVASGFPQSCATCHNSTAWSPAVFDHSQTQFPLTGAHSSRQCQDCHKNGQYTGLSTACASCHLADFNGTTNPNHVASGFPQDCSTCHSTAAWSPAAFDHSKTQFPLTGAHTSRQCLDCHQNGQYAGLSTECVSCHLANFNNATNPNHVSAGFPQTCATCHNTTAWTPSIFDHNKTKFPLTGAHTTVQCVNCHISGVYAGTPADCYSCHSSLYNSATNPNHAAAQFPRDCSQCHNTSSWSGAVFNHTWFPIYSGSHAGKWSTCNDCHTNSNDYSVFSCITCHEHEKTRMDSAHAGVSNYVFNSSNCYSCHPNGTH